MTITSPIAPPRQPEPEGEDTAGTDTAAAAGKPETSRTVENPATRPDVPAPANAKPAEEETEARPQPQPKAKPSHKDNARTDKARKGKAHEATAPAPVPATPPELTHHEILRILSGLLIVIFVSNVAGTVVGNALPTITATLQASQGQYTWIVTSMLLASTASTPIWGKLADLFNKKHLLMIGLMVFNIGSIASGAAQTTAQLIAARAVQGIGSGATMALVGAIIGSSIPPLARGRYMAYTGAATAAATVTGPLAGGFIVDASWLGWRWCFWSAVPFMLLAMLVLQFNLRVPRLRTGKAHVDWLGATVVSAATCDLLIWISFAGDAFPYLSWQTAVMVGSTVLLSGLFVLVECRVKDPIIPMNILRMRNTALAVIASIAVGLGMFGASVFLGQYFQVAREYTPTQAGLMMLPMMAGTMVSSVFVGRWVSSIGVWKPFVLVGSLLLTAGFGAMATVDHATNLGLIGVYGAVIGIGVGMAMQNLVLAVQNSVSIYDVGSASATVAFFRSLGGTIGVQVLGAIFASGVAARTRDGLAALAAKSGGTLGGSATQATSSLDLAALPAPVEQVVRGAYGDSLGQIFLVAAIVSVVSVVCCAFMKGTRLRSAFDMTPSEDM